LGRLGAVAAAAALRQLPLSGQTPAPPFRIDIHQHFVSPAVLAEVTRRNVGNANMRRWTAALAIEEMDRSSTATAVLSLTRPGVWFGDVALARTLARESNEYAARLVADQPKRFGLFAILPLPDVDGSLREIEYCFDTLKADGIGVMSNYGDIYLGDPRIAPVIDELNRRKAVVFEHPIREDRDNPLNGIELVTETTRTIHSLLYNATVVRCPDIRFIFSHGGGTIASVTGRLGGLEQKLPRGVMYELQKFYFDTAQAVNPSLLLSYKALVPVPHLLFGTDFPLGAGVLDTAKGLRENGGFSDRELRAIERDNALELIPRLRA
jgi:predicted TIM-barrel fold metal-dependent hydrolase